MLRVIAILLLATAQALAERAKRCDAAKLEADGNDQIAMGNTFAAFTKYEAAAKCKPSDGVHQRAAFAACTLARKTKSEHWVNQAKRYIALLPEQMRQRVVQVCSSGCGGPDGGRSD